MRAPFLALPLDSWLHSCAGSLAAIMPWGSGDNNRQVVYKPFWVTQMRTAKNTAHSTLESEGGRALGTEAAGSLGR